MARRPANSATWACSRNRWTWRPSTPSSRPIPSAGKNGWISRASSRAERQAHFVLDLAQRDDGARLPDARQVEQEPVQEPVVRLRAFYQDLQQEVGIARDRIAFEDLGRIAHRALEGLDRAGRVPLEADLREHAALQPDLGAVHLRTVAQDDAGRLQRLDPPPYRGGRQPHLLGQLLRRSPAVFLQGAQDADVSLVHIPPQ